VTESARHLPEAHFRVGRLLAFACGQKPGAGEAQVGAGGLRVTRPLGVGSEGQQANSLTKRLLLRLESGLGCRKQADGLRRALTRFGEEEPEIVSGPGQQGGVAGEQR
jgi:hypothetical protein